MIPIHGKVVLRVNMRQKDTLIIGDTTVSTALKFEVNHREKSPVVAEVVIGNRFIKPGEILLCHHNLFYHPSPYFLMDDQFAVPFGKTLFAKIDSEGNLSPICGNLLCDRVDISTPLPLPVEHRKQYLDRVIVTDGYGTKYKKGQLVFTRPYSFYQIVYNWNGIEKRVHKCDTDMIVGFLR